MSQPIFKASVYQTRETALCYDWLIEEDTIDLEKMVAEVVSRYLNSWDEMNEAWAEFMERWKDWRTCTETWTNLTDDDPQLPYQPRKVPEFIEVFYDYLGDTISCNLFLALDKRCGRSLLTSIVQLTADREHNINYTTIAKRLIRERFPETLLELERFKLADSTV